MGGLDNWYLNQRNIDKAATKEGMMADPSFRRFNVFFTIALVVYFGGDELDRFFHIYTRFPGIEFLVILFELIAFIYLISLGVKFLRGSAKKNVSTDQASTLKEDSGFTSKLKNTLVILVGLLMIGLVVYLVIQSV